MRRWKTDYGKVASLSFSRDGRRLASCTVSGYDVYIWDVTTGELVRTWTLDHLHSGYIHAGPVQAVCFAPDADFLAIGRQHFVELWESSGWRRVAEVKINNVDELTVGPGAAPLVAKSDFGSAQVWEVNAGHTRLSQVMRWSFSIPEGVLPQPSRLAFSPDGRRIARHTPTGVEVRQIPERRPLFSLEDEAAVTLAHPPSKDAGLVRFSPDSRRLAFCHSNAIESHPSTLDDPADVIRYAGHTKPVSVVRYTPDGRSLVSASFDGTVRVWEAATGLPERVFNLTTYRLLSGDVSPDGTLAAVGGSNGEIVVWDLE
jgi:WD40 repeat protein